MSSNGYCYLITAALIVIMIVAALEDWLHIDERRSDRRPAISAAEGAFEGGRIAYGRGVALTENPFHLHTLSSAGLAHAWICGWAEAEAEASELEDAR